MANDIPIQLNRRKASHMDDHDNHGHSVAAWTTVVIIIVGFALGSWAVAVASIPLIWVSVAIIALGGVAGKVLAMAGYGAKPGGSVS